MYSCVLKESFLDFFFFLTSLKLPEIREFYPVAMSDCSGAQLFWVSQN